MNQKNKAAATAMVVALCLAAALFDSGPRVVCTGFLPPNDLKIPDGVHPSGIGQEMFDQVLDKVESLYAPIVAARGARLIVNRRWKDPTVNASANQSGSSWFINMYGGLARHPTITAEGFALVACHELGHHLGGFPKYGGDDWATNEGGADYYATLKCLRRFFPDDKTGEPVDAAAKAACEKAFPKGGDRNHCQSGSMAGMSVASLFQALRPGTPKPDFATPDPAVVEEMFDAHPAAQCRLDTYFQGALCVKPVSEEQSETEEAPGACTRPAGFAAGTRPLCWYKPPAPPAPAPNPEVASTRLALPQTKAVQEKLDALRAALSGRGI